MALGENVLSRIPARWDVTNGNMTDALISLSANGAATLKLYDYDLTGIADSFVLYLISNVYSNPYAPQVWAEFFYVSADGIRHSYKVPVVDNGSGICSVKLYTQELENFASCYFKLYSSVPVAFSEWILSAPTVDINIDEIKEEIPRMLADYNTSTFEVGAREDTIALISSNLLKSTDVGGKLQITFVASESCEVTIRLKDNAGTELMAPLLYEVPRGRSSIGVPHAYLKRQAGIHTFTATAQCSNGSLTFFTRSILYVVDAGHLAQRIIDVGSRIYDIAIQQLPSDSTPSQIWAIGQDPDGITRVRKRPYNEAGAPVWEPVYSIGNAIDAAIEFNGVWIRRTGDEYFTLECEVNPWIFIVSSNGDLTAQVADDEVTRITLANGVSQVSACRGFKSEMFLEQDQGLIVAYIKDGQAYYRHYIYSVPAGRNVWDTEVHLEELGTGITELQVHRLNDYRVGFVATSTSGNKWLISTRTYVAAAFSPEHVYMSIDAGIALAAVHTDNANYATPVIQTEVSDDWLTLTVTCNYPLFIRDNFYSAFGIEDTAGCEIASYDTYGSILTIRLAKKPRSGWLFLTPIKVVAYLPNSGYIKVPDDAWKFYFGINSNITEHIDLNIGATVSIIPKAMLPIEVDTPTENVELNIVTEINIQPKSVSYLYETMPDESVELNIGASISIVPSYVGIEPV